ncbi:MULTISPECIES: hypothetical protein [Vibrio]|jgi:hypothetical protein|uniref:hypothetical protein n=1 Tax=Vibrio TaxID=662 RepID=UPI0002C47D24|nr:MULTISPECIES: hypothetical protein [Vibrio]AWB01552.1 hypothetical protein CU052_20085 [Vibrio harveyi]EKO3803137.1 hypothetical protein [Vibrio harveyi]EKO3813102.1 hypothetical protein [Vibrio harveyi]EKO3817319.1 hypothetical protein [Vibrio harveyi]EKO3820612.1 hypothetical protein [Vibrio harveyi]
MDILRIQQGKQTLSAITIIIAVLFQLYLTSTAALNPTQIHSENWLNQVQDEKVLLCTADGFKWVDINELIEANALPNSEFVQDLNLHDGFQFECPLLQAAQFFISIALGLYLATLSWLRRTKNTLIHYQFAICGKQVYKHVAPKQSPPCAFLA